MEPCRLLSVKFTDSMAATTHLVNPLPFSWHNPKSSLHLNFPKCRLLL